MKRICLLALEIIAITLLLAGCMSKVPYELYDENQMSRWTSEDGNIDIYLTKDYFGCCVIKEEPDNLTLCFRFHSMGISCYEPVAFFSHSKDAKYNVSFSTGDDNFSKRDSDGLYRKFTVNVFGSDYYEDGEKIAFNLVESNLDESKVPFVYPPFPIDKPISYPLSKWELSDKSMTFYVDSVGIGCGYITSNEEKIAVYCSLSGGKNYFSELLCYDISTYRPVEEWRQSHPDEETDDSHGSDKGSESEFWFYVNESTYYEPRSKGVIKIVDDNIYFDDAKNIVDLFSLSSH